MKNKKLGFTLIELLVVVLIIGILAAIAVPQYQIAVMKANFHKGIPLVESLYQAQQAYALIHGDFATDVDDLDLSIPSDCIKREKVSGSTDSKYDCPWGVIGIGSGANIHYISADKKLLYAHYYKDAIAAKILHEAGKRYCFGTDENARNICESFGGENISSPCSNGGWCRYKLP